MKDPGNFILMLAMFSLGFASCMPRQMVNQEIINVTPLVTFETQPGLIIQTPTLEPSLTPTTTGIPVPTLEPTPIPPTPTVKAPFFDQFVLAIKNNNPSQVVGVYVDGVLADRVVQQPSSNPGYVSTIDTIVTQFGLVAKTFSSNIGLLAHNYLAGQLFFNLLQGQDILLIYGDGSVTDYEVSSIDQFQALSPTSPSSQFVDLATGETLTATELFLKVFGGDAKTTMQTCIAQGSESSWGRLFIIAPITDP